MYNNPYYNPQSSLDRINAQINELERAKAQYQQQPIQQPITQNFQLTTPNHDVIRYANSLEEVERNVVIGETPYFSKDMSVVWIKNLKGEIKTYELIEIIPKDEKDMQIEYLMSQVEELKGMINNDANVTDVNAEQSTTNTSRNDETVRTAIKKTEPTGIPKISGSKKK